MTEYQKTKHVLPSEVADAFSGIEGAEERNAYVAALRAAQWTLESIAVASGLTRERVRQIVKSTTDATTDHPVPTPPVKVLRAKPVYIEPHPDTLERLLELKPLAQKVRGNSTQYRAEAEEYTALLWKAYNEEKVTLYRLAKRLGISHGAIRFRLARYEYITPKGTSRVYTPVDKNNRAI